MTIRIKVQVWRDDTLISEDLIPVGPYLDFWRDFDIPMYGPIIDGPWMLHGIGVRQKTSRLTKEHQCER